MVLTNTDPETADLADWFVAAINDLVRGEPSDLDGHLVTVGSVQTIGTTKTSCHVRFLARDGNQRPLLASLARTLASEIVDYCIPRSRVAEAMNQFRETRSTSALMRLQGEARDLFTSLGNSGEGGEILLAVLLEKLLGAPQLLCKMSLKTNSEMHVHGTDGIHIQGLPDGGLAVYWGESKLHATVTSAVSSAFESIAPFLLDDGAGAAQRDLLLVRDHLDTGSEVLDEYLKTFFTEGHTSIGRREIRGASLVGFSLDDYPMPHDGDGNVNADVAQAIERWHGLVKNRVAATALESFDITVFCVPLPSVDEFRAAVSHALGLT